MNRTVSPRTAHTDREPLGAPVLGVTGTGGGGVCATKATERRCLASALRAPAKQVIERDGDGGEGAASLVLLSRAMLNPGWRSTFAFPCINAGIQLEDVDVFLMHLHLKPEYIISLLHTYFTHI